MAPRRHSALSKRAVLVHLLVQLSFCVTSAHTTPQNAQNSKRSTGSSASGDAASAEYALFEARPLQMPADVADQSGGGIQSGPTNVASPHIPQAVGQLPQLDSLQVFSNISTALANLTLAPNEAQLLNNSAFSSLNQSAQQILNNHSLTWGNLTSINLTSENLGLRNLTKYAPPSWDVLNATTTNLRMIYHSYIDALAKMDCIGNA